MEALENIGQNPYYYGTGYQTIDAISSLIRLAVAVCTIIGLWKMFDKAGEHGWGAIIPFYNDYLLFKISDIKNWFWSYLVAGLIGGICIFIAVIYFIVYAISAAFGAYGTSDFASAGGAMLALFAIGGICCLFTFIVRIFRAIKLSQAYQLGGGWAVGLILLPWLFYMIIGCSKTINHKKYPFGVPKPQAGVQPGYQQNPYQQNPYQQGGYTQNTYQQNPYAQNAYQNNYYAQNTAQADQPAPLNPYANNPYMQNQTAQAPQNVQPAQPAQPAQNPYAQAPDSSQNPYQNPPKDQVWNTIYDENKNNL